MKKLSTVRFLLFFILAVSFFNTNAQENIYVVSSIASLSSGGGNTINTPFAPGDNVSADFSKRFQNASDVIWSKKDNFMFAYFKENGVPVRVTYDKKGKLNYTIRYFYGSNIPTTISNFMRSNGYDMAITNVTEVKSRYGTTQFVKMEDETSYITIKVHADREISVYETYSKSR